jgi:hypothetical protein
MNFRRMGQRIFELTQLDSSRAAVKSSGYTVLKSVVTNSVMTLSWSCSSQPVEAEGRDSVLAQHFLDPLLIETLRSVC